MDRSTFMIFAAAAMSAVGIVGDYFLKRASGEANPLTTPSFLVGLALYSSTAFAWVFVMRHLKLAAIGANLLCLHDPDAHQHGLFFLQ